MKRPQKLLFLLTSLLCLGLPAGNAAAATVYQDGFESASLDAAWSAGTTNNGRVAVSAANGPATGLQHLVLDDSVSDATFSVAEATLKLDLSSKKNVVLTFKAKSLGNEADAPPAGNFTTTRTFDGVSISGDGGITWRAVQSLAALGTSWQTFAVTVDSSVTSLGTTFGANFLIRFSEYDNAPAPLDGIAIDDVMVTADDDQRAVLELPTSLSEGQTNQTGYVLLAFAPSTPLVFSLSASPSGQLNLPATVTVPAGQTYASFTFSVVDDSLVNLSRSVTVSCAAAGVTTTPASVLVLDNESPTATLTIPSSLTEGALPTSNATISIDRVPTVSVTFNLSASPSSEVSIPTTVTIPAGQTQVAFTIRAVDDTKIDGDVPVTVTASSSSMASVTAQTTAVDNEVKTLSFTLPTTIQEGGTGSGTVKISGTLLTSLTVNLTSATPAQATVPATATIAAGQTQATFTITAVDNALKDGSRTVNLSAAAAAFTSASGSVMIRDNEVASYRFAALADIVNVSNALAVTVSAADVEGNVISGGSGGTVNLSVVLPTGTAQALSPASATLSAGTWTGNVTLPAVSSAPLKLRASDGTGATGDSTAFDIMRVLAIAADDLVTDASRSRIYASVPQAATGSYANKVVAINPANLAVTASAATNNDPGQLALTSGGEYLYAALDGNGTVARINPATMAVVSTFAVGTDTYYGTLYAEDIATVAGSPETVIVSQYRKSVSPRHNGVAAYDNGVIRPNKTQDHTGSNRIEPSADPTLFFGYNNETTEYGFRQLRLGAAGLSEIKVNGSLFAGFYMDFHTDGDKAFSDGGVEVDGALMKRLGTFTLPSGGGATRPDLAANRVYFLEGSGSSSYPSTFDKIGAYDPTTFALIKRLTLSSSFDGVGSFIRWGANGLAFKTSTSIVVINSSQLVPSDPAADLVTTVQATPNPATVGSALTYTVQVTNQGPNTARNVTLGTVLSTGQTLQTVAASSGTATTSGSTISLPVGDLAMGSTITLTVTTLPQQAGSLTCTASSNSSSLDTNFANNTGFKLVSVGFVAAVDTVNTLSLKANNLVYDATRSLLWATIPSTVEAPLGRSLVSINPANGLMSDPIAINASPVGQCMALSANGRYLYVGLSDASEVARFDLNASPVTSIRIPLGNSQWGSANYAEDLEVLDGDGTSFLMAGSGDHAAAVFDSSTGLRTSRTGIYTVDRVERTATAGTFVGYNSYTSGFDLSKLLVNSGGVTAPAKNGSVISGYNVDISGSGDLLLSSTGKLVNSSTLSLAFNLGISGRPCMDVFNRRAYLVNGSGLRAFSSADGTSAGTLSLPVTSTGDWAQSCLRWGVNGLAILGNDGNIYITRWGQVNAMDANKNGLPDAWEVASFGALGASADDDPDHDGIPNALEYVFGTSPTQASSNPMKVSLGVHGATAAAIQKVGALSSNSQQITIVFPRRVGIQSEAYGFESSTDLKHWTRVQSISETVISTASAGDVDTETVEALLPLPLGGKGFVRMKWIETP